MGDLVKSSGRKLSGGWFSFWAAVLLILPNCSFNVAGLDPGPNLHTGPPPHTAAIFCDIEMERRCATPTDLAMGTRLASAAVALVAGQSGTTIGIDDSPAALAACAGSPQAVVFKDSFPRGTSVCLNCGEAIPALHADPPAVCQAKCQDQFGTITTDGSIDPDNPPTAETLAFCAANARVSTNFPLNSCFEGACTLEGTLRLDFADPRRIPEPVVWQDVIGASVVGSTLTRTAANTGLWDAGATSSQVIAGGDGYVEFTATETNRARIGGLSSGAPPDPDPGYVTINFALFLANTDEIFVIENGVTIQTFGPYAPGEKFRVKVRDNFDGTAVVSYARLTGPCVDGMPCNETVFHTSSVPGTYPFRVDASFLEQDGTFTDVRLVRIR